jgi:tRNA(Ser,Leu) C12 N-acetylase TAN1|uniref:THUMP domain-containing protein n=2 Tax=Candidatus Methanosuratincola (ex Vanwonterghem et al. 2016) TaxID=1915412 RepID=A0A7J3V094_9CREN
MMEMVLITVEYGKEDRAEAEVLDCILPLDPDASVRRTGFGGILILETSLDTDRAAESIAGSLSRLVRSAIPVDQIVRSEISEIEEVAASRVRIGSKIAVRCRRRGSSLPSPKEVECIVGRRLKGIGCAVDLKNPDQIVRIEIIGEITAVSVRPPNRSVFKARSSRVQDS